MAEQYEMRVTISNYFEAESPYDAVDQMIEWLVSHSGAVHGGYHVDWVADSGDETIFIDASGSAMRQYYKKKGE